ncbi:MAG: hypothetical protein Q9212_007082 [Teloschistes hypoglaucus]
MALASLISSLSRPQLFWSSSIFFLFWLAALAIRRIFFSPLSRIPGPWLAAASGWYEFYYDCILCGQMPGQIDRLHEVYGPIVRISPGEVHVQDPDFIKQLLSTHAKLDKDPWYYRFVGFPESGVSTGPAALHHIRRRVLLKSFTQQSVRGSMHIIEDKVRELLSLLGKHKGTGREVELSNALRCLAFDIACNYALPRSTNKLQEKDFAPEFNRMMVIGRYVSMWQRHVRVLVPLILHLPHRLMGFLGHEKYLAVMKIHSDVKNQATELIASKGTTWVPQRHSTILHSMFNSDLPEYERSIGRMTQEGVTVIGAGVEALANPLAITVFELLKDPEKIRALKQELKEVENDVQAMLSHDQLRKLPYLGAIIMEGLRLGKENGRFPRINPSSPTFYRDHIIPAGTVMSISLKDLHLNGAIFEDPHAFKPERWLDPENAKELRRNFLPFSRGDRVCLGRHLAMAEAFVCVGNLVHRFDMQLWRTTQKDVDTCFDYFALNKMTETTGLRVVIH